MNACGIILAAGRGSRAGGGKLTRPFRGRPLFHFVLAAAACSQLQEVAVVTNSPEISAFAIKKGFLPVACPNAAQGLSASIRAGVASLPGRAGYLFFVCDQPFLTAHVVDALLQSHSGGITVPVYGGQRGTPVLFDGRLEGELLALSGESGGRQVMAAHPELVTELAFPDRLTGVDLDTPSDFLRHDFPMEMGGNLSKLLK